MLPYAFKEVTSAEDSRLFYQEDTSQEDACKILLFKDVIYKAKSASRLLQVSRDLL